MRHNRYIFGTVINHSMFSEDLIPEFVDTLESFRLTREERVECKEIRKRMQGEGYYSSDESDYDMEYLFDHLDNYAAPYFYFGSHPGDGSDYGFWLSEDAIDATFDGKKVSDLSEVPKGYTGEVLLVHDHGNTSLYSYSRGRGREIWAIV